MRGKDWNPPRGTIDASGNQWETEQGDGQWGQSELTRLARGLRRGLELYLEKKKRLHFTAIYTL